MSRGEITFFALWLARSDWTVVFQSQQDSEDAGLRGNAAYAVCSGEVVAS